MFYDHDAHRETNKVMLYIVAPLLNSVGNEEGLNDDLGWDYVIPETNLIAHVSSPYSPNDELISLNGSDDEGIDSGSIYLDYIPSRDFGEKEIEIGTRFGLTQDFRLVLRVTALRGKFDIKFTRNDRDRVSVVCKADCGWKIYVSKPEDENCLIVKIYLQEHRNCLWFHTNAQASSSYIANKYIKQFRINPNMFLSTLKSTIASDMDIDMSKHKVSRAKMKALKMIEGNEANQYQKMRDYCSLILRTNPGSVVKLQTEPSTVENIRRFQRVFICYAAMKTSFKKGCKPLIGVDGCFLKGPYGGHLLSAVANDGNGQMFPVAFAVVDSEIKDSWEWFMGELMDAVRPYHGITFISDRQKGLVETFDNMMKRSDHKFCVRHLYENFKLRSMRLNVMVLVRQLTLIKEYAAVECGSSRVLM
ncbi:uncharacterized protein LOC132301057 [Cornus florida]|uniref:uncharacterized protein LOC132301057 n=1 Tax=Cornus florida TaxID=4283 RepID=UPI00289E1397|nr:uncharacterized protein LOC132301057 [Cornus florida]